MTTTATDQPVFQRLSDAAPLNAVFRFSLELQPCVLQALEAATKILGTSNERWLAHAAMDCGDDGLLAKLDERAVKATIAFGKLVDPSFQPRDEAALAPQEHAGRPHLFQFYEMISKLNRETVIDALPVLKAAFATRSARSPNKAT